MDEDDFLTNRILERHVMKKRYLMSVILLVMALFLSSLSSCTKTKAVFKKMVPKSVVKKMRPTPDLKKRVMVMPLIEHAGLGEEAGAFVTSTFLGVLKKSSHILIYESEKGTVASSKKKLTGLGVVVPDHKLIKKADDLGMHAIITGIVNPVETNTKKAGIWPFRKYHKTYEISAVINVIDVMSQTLLLTQLESEKESVSSKEIERTNEKGLILELVRDLLPGILKRQASVVSKTVSKLPWTGKVLAAEDEHIKINGGKDVGLRTGVYFSVHNRGEAISSGGGKVLGLLGDKTGEVKVIAVEEDHSVAVTVVGGPFKKGQIVKMDT